MWYSNLFRRHLLDMHIEDWDPLFLSEFSPEVYVKNLKRAKINYAMIYLQSHVGLCYFPTKVGSIHRALEGKSDLIRQVVDLCHQSDIKVCGYYSLIYNTREHDKHPDWQMKHENGISGREGKVDATGQVFTSTKGRRYGLCCPTNPDYRKFVYDQIDEILEYFDVDAMFFDMPFWPHTCYCKHCLQAAGGTIPEEINDQLNFKARLMGDFIQSVTDHVKSVVPICQWSTTLHKPWRPIVEWAVWKRCWQHVTTSAEISTAIFIITPLPVSFTKMQLKMHLLSRCFLVASLPFECIR